MKLRSYVNRAPSVYPVNLTDTGTPRSGLRFGAENNAFAFSGANAATTTQGSSILGSVNARLVQLNPPNIPSSGDLAYVWLFRTAAASATSNRTEVIFGVDGQTSSGGTGGQLAFKSATIQTGSSTTGVTIDSTNSGRISVRRQNSVASWQLWPQTTVGADLSGIALEPDTAYVGMIAIIGARPRITFVNIETGVVQTLDGGTDITGTRPSAPLFNLIGGLGSGADRQGFAGECMGVMVYHGAVPTNAQLQSLATGALTPSTLATAAGATLAYWNRMDFSRVSGSTLASEVGNNATIVTGVSGFEAGGALAPTNGIRFRRLGKYYVFPAEIGATTGKVWFEGTANANEQIACWVRYVDGTTSAQVRITADSTGYFLGSATVPITKPFYKSAVSVADRTRVCHEYEVQVVDLVIPECGQSERNIQYSAAWTSSSDFTPVVGSNSGLAQTTALGSDAGPWIAHTDLQAINTTTFRPNRARGPKARPRRVLGKGWTMGDGAYATAARILTDRSRCVNFVNVARSGHPIDCFIFDKVTFSQSITLSGSGSGPYTATITLTDAQVQAAFSGILSAGDNAALVVSSSFRNQVRPGTFSLNLGGVTITDTRVSDSSGTLSGTGVSSGTITYVAGTGTGSATISITFTGTPAAMTGTLMWQPKQETLGGGSTNKTENIDGYGVREALDDICTNALRYGFSIGTIWWATSNISDAGGGAAMRASLTAKYELMRRLLKSYCLPAVTGAVADPPMMVMAKGRDTGNGATAIDNARALAEELWNSSRTWVRRGGHYYDNRLDVSTSPHQTYNDDSGPRIGRRQGAYLSNIIAGTPIREPQFRAGAATRTSSTVLTVPLSYIDTGLTLTVASGGNANALDQWYVGGVLVANDATTIARVSADGLAVELVKLSGSWATGDENNVLYVAGAPGSGTTIPASLLYDNRGGFGGSEPGLLVAPKLS